MISYVGVSNMLLRPLESKYLPITDTSVFQNIKWVVVLSGGHSTDSKLSVTDQLSGTSLVRLIERIRLHKKLSNSKSLLSGGSTYGSVSEVSLMAEMATELGTGKKKLVLESDSKDIKDQASYIHNIIGER